MAVVVEMQNTGNPEKQAEIIAQIEHALCEKPGDWRVLIHGSRGHDDWELKIYGPTGFERTYTLIGSAGQHQPDAIRAIVLKLVPPMR